MLPKLSRIYCKDSSSGNKHIARLLGSEAAILTRGNWTHSEHCTIQRSTRKSLEATTRSKWRTEGLDTAALPGHSFPGSSPNCLTTHLPILEYSRRPQLVAVTTTMHFAFPPRKTSNPPPYAVRSSTPSYLRNERLRYLVVLVLGVIGVLYLLISLLSGSGGPSIPSGTPGVVIVTTLEPELSKAHRDAIIANRRDYASRHGKTTSPRTMIQRNKRATD